MLLAKQAMATPFRDGTVADLAEQVLEIARRGLEARGQRGVSGLDETQYLAPLEEIVESRRAPAELLLERFHGPWAGSVDPIYQEMAY